MPRTNKLDLLKPRNAFNNKWSYQFITYLTLQIMALPVYAVFAMIAILPLYRVKPSFFAYFLNFRL